MTIIFLLDKPDDWRIIQDHPCLQTYYMFCPDRFNGHEEAELEDALNHSNVAIAIDRKSPRIEFLRSKIDETIHYKAILIAEREIQTPQNDLMIWEPNIVGIDGRGGEDYIILQIMYAVHNNSPIWVLSSYVRGAIFNSAPENRPSLEKAKNYCWHLRPPERYGKTKFWVFKASPEDKKISCSIPSLEFIWVNCLYFLHRCGNDIAPEVQVIPANEIESLMEWAEGILQANYSDWPDSLPRPDTTKYKSAYRAVDDYFLMACGWLFRHEVEHILDEHFQHQIESKEAERKADAAAANHIFAEAQDNNLIEEKRGIGVVLALMMLLHHSIITEDYNGYGQYPHIAERIQNTLSQMPLTARLAWNFAFCIMEFLLGDPGISSKDKSYHDRLAEYYQLLSRQLA